MNGGVQFKLPAFLILISQDLKKVNNFISVDFQTQLFK